MKNRDNLLFSITKKDLKITYFSGSGAGGQHRNRHNNCVRINHPNSGVTVQATEHKSLSKNKQLAFKRLGNDKKFRIWLKSKAAGMLNTDIPEIKKSNQRIRTYNFPENRVTDHRINLTIHNNLDQILDGNLDELISKCILELQNEYENL